MEKEIKNDFTKGSVGKNIIGMAVPMITASLVNVMYSVVDRMYIGHIPGEGSLALTGLGLTMPLISAISAFTALCGTGGAPLCSIARGRGENEYAEKIMGNAFTMLLIFGVLLTAGVLVFLEPILYAFGASDATYPFASEYAGIYVAGTMFVMISLGMNYYINAQGFAKIGMLTVAIGAVINIILDPVLIFVFNMGIKGAALATIFSQFCSGIWALAFICGKKAILKLRLKNMKPDLKIIGRILSLGVTGFVMSVTNGLVQIAANSQLEKLGGDLYVGAMTVINSVREIFFMISQGITHGAQPVLGYNYGARQYGRVRSGIRFMTVATVSYAVAAWTLIMLFPGALTKVFNSDPELVQVCVPAMKKYFCAFATISLMAVGQSTFVGLGKAKRAVFFSSFRKVILEVPMMYLLPLVISPAVDGVFYSEPVSDVLGGLACFITMYFTIYRPLGRLKDGEAETVKI